MCPAIAARWLAVGKGSLVRLRKQEQGPGGIAGYPRQRGWLVTNQRISRHRDRSLIGFAFFTSCRLRRNERSSGAVPAWPTTAGFEETAGG